MGRKFWRGSRDGGAFARIYLFIYISKNMLQSAKGRYLENYLWEAAVDWRQLFPLGR